MDVDTTNKKVILNDKYQYPLGEVVSTPFGRLKFVQNTNYEESEKPKQLYFSLINPKARASGLLGV